MRHSNSAKSFHSTFSLSLTSPDRRSAKWNFVHLNFLSLRRSQAADNGSTFYSTFIIFTNEFFLSLWSNVDKFMSSCLCVRAAIEREREDFLHAFDSIAGIVKLLFSYDRAAIPPYRPSTYSTSERERERIRSGLISS